MSFLKKLFGGSSGDGESSQGPQAVEYKGFRIFPEPQKESAGHRIGARIEKDFGDETKTHMLIRADVISDLDDAVEASLMKARQMIDQQGDAIF